MAFYQSLAYEASAGSGKTFALVIRYISLLYLGARPHTILALTFTNKAANEMQERIATVLAQLHLPKRAAERAEIAKTLEISEAEIIQKQETIYQNYLQSSLKISTIDKFFGQIVRLFSQHLGIMPDFTIDQKRDELRFALRFIRNIRQDESYRDLVSFAARESKRLGDIFRFLDGLYENDAQLRPFISACHQKQPPNDEALRKELARLHLFFEEQCPKLSQSGRNALDISAFSRLEEMPDKRSWLCKSSLAEYNYFKKCYKPQADEIFYQIKEAFEAYFDGRDRYLLTRYLHLYQIYKQTLLEENIQTNILSFTDVTNLLYELLHEKIDRDFLYFRLDTSIEHLLIDEFQDTNIIQYRILAPIIEEIHAGLGTGALKSFFYVGDIKQSIYRFRGGKKELFHFVRKKYGVTLKQLDTNYRSDCAIVQFVNETFRSLIDGYYDQKCHNPDSGGYVKVTIDEDVIDQVTQEVFALLELGVGADDIAILTFTNDAAFEIEEALLQKNPSLQITTQSSALLINQPVVAAVIETLMYLYFKAPLPRANALALSGRSWLDTLDLSHLRPDTPLPKLVREIIHTLALPGDDPNLIKLIETVTTYADIEAFLFESETLTVESPSKKSEGIKILTIHKSKGLEFGHVILADHTRQQKANSETFLYDYDEIDLQDIYIRTKKRECVDTRYRHAREKLAQLEYEDTLNLLYVACTRASHSLILCQNANQKHSVFARLQLQEIARGIPKGSVASTTQKEHKPLLYQPKALGTQEKPPTEKPQTREDIHAINYGNALHYMLEVMDGFSPEDLDNAYWAMKNRYEMLLKEGDAESIRKRIENLLSYAPFMALVEGEISKEQPLLFEERARQIDLLVRHEKGYRVIDYKSSQTQRSEHRQQVRLYKRAISQITGATVSGWLCYIMEDGIELVEVD